ncbi:IucA/IucC family C-terminal-domain containing protein [Alkalicoccobacillus murimartini]|uniref:Siderophore-iron reductase FhuF n=1 Tax=Alkalicoccobacillus murimartini TaxID=171685 RepID=A0ABT9YJF4_9BACI|nr:IucA/IucC family C-terminal-domain containing protein [Alkalicoccobacillus murimartini]MDQ0207342.1 siderophore-iron reductase FhuF [Alkalicoccobacillus murimartini]
MAVNSLQLEDLKSFGILPWTSDTQGMRITDLLDENTCREFLDQYMNDIGAPTRKVAASLFMKHYARLTVAMALHQMSIKNGVPAIPVEACLFNKDRKLCIEPEHYSWQEWHTDARQAWQYEKLQTIITEHITPLIINLNKVAKLSNKILWENVAVRINSVYRKLLAQNLDQTQRNQLVQDFYFLKQADGELCKWKENPLAPYLHLETPETGTCARQTCCMYYMMPKNEYCGVCPLPKNPSS